jgi:hypothetical protein
VAGIALNLERSSRQIDLVDVVDYDPGIEPRGVPLKTLHELGAHDTIDIGWPVVDVGRGH